MSSIKSLSAAISLSVLAAAGVTGCFQKFDAGAGLQPADNSVPGQPYLAFPTDGGSYDGNFAGKFPYEVFDAYPLVTADGSTNDQCAINQAQAMDVLQSHCAQCHDEATACPGKPASCSDQFYFILDVNMLLSPPQSPSGGAFTINFGSLTNLLVPGQPLQSAVYAYPASIPPQMPPAPLQGGKPTVPLSIADLSVLQQWINNCLPGDGASTDGGPVPPPPGDAGAVGGAGGRGGSGGEGEGGAGGEAEDGGGGRAGGAGGAGGAAGAPPPATPCTGLCTGPIPFTTPFQSSAFAATAECWQTTSATQGYVCGNMGARTFSVNGGRVTCNNASVNVPAARNGGYCFQVGAGTSNGAFFSTF